MNIKKGNIKNINVKLTSMTLALTLLTSGLTGCAKEFKYTKELNNGETITTVNGVMDANSVKNLKLIELKVDDSRVLFLTKKILYNKFQNSEVSVEYKNIFDDCKIFSIYRDAEENDKQAIKLVGEESLSDYLSLYGYTQNKYTIDDLEKIFYEIKDNDKYKDSRFIVKR